MMILILMDIESFVKAEDVERCQIIPVKMLVSKALEIQAVQEILEIQAARSLGRSRFS